MPVCFSTLILVLMGCSFAFSQTLKISVDKDSINFNEAAVVTVTGEAKDIRFYAELPEMDGAIVIARTSFPSMNYGNGKIKIIQTFTLQALKSGKINIGPASLQVGSQRIFSNKISVFVKTSLASSSSKAIFLRCEPSKKQAVVGEQITLSINLYFQCGLKVYPQYETLPYAPTFNGFWYQSGKMPETPEDTIITINGFKYFRITLYKEFVFPNTIGNLKIPSYEYTCTIKQNPYPTEDDRINDLMGIPTDVVLHSSEVPIQVAALTEKNRPDNFGGDLGQFSLESTIDKTELKTNESIKITATISGIGNISFIQLPKQTYPENIEGFPPTSTDRIHLTDKGVEGSKTFSITLIPKKEGKYIIPGISFSYFDPEKKDYITLTTPDFPIHVLKGDSLQNFTENNLPEGFLDETSTTTKILKIVLVILPQVLLLIGLVFLWKRKKAKKKIENNVKEYENEKKPENVTEQNNPNQILFSNVESTILAGNFPKTISNLYEILLDACCKKCELTREEASIQQLRYRMKMKKLQADKIEEIISLLDELSLLRFAGNLDRQICYSKFQQTRLVIDNLTN